MLLKLSGELFGDEKGKGIRFESFERIASQITTIWKKTGIELAIVVGGGNIFRGREIYGLKEVLFFFLASRRNGYGGR